jgi:DNA-binding transcriptional LysR family regulator
MEFYQLHSFVAVAETKNLTRASEKLHTSQPAVSAHIKTLEEEFCVQLFKRTAKGMQLTSEGSLILKAVQQLLTSAKNVENLAASFRTVATGEIKIGLNTDPVIIRVKELVQLLRNDFPKLKLHFKNASSSNILTQIKKKELDAGFLMGDYQDEAIKKWQLHTIGLNIVAPFHFRDQIRKARKIDLKNLPWLNIPKNSPLNNILSELFENQPINFIETETATIDDEITFNSLIGTSSGLCLLREDLAIAAAEKNEIIIWENEKIFVPLYFACLKSQEEHIGIYAVSSIVRQLWK